MVDGDNIDEVQILLPEDKIQVTVNLHTSFILELSIFLCRKYIVLSVMGRVFKSRVSGFWKWPGLEALSNGLKAS